MTCKHGYVWCPGFDQWHSQLPRPCPGCVTEAKAELVRLRHQNTERVAVSVATAVLKGDKLLVQRRTGRHANGCWSMPGGHMEKWETFEQTALRELREEVGSAMEVSQPVLWTVNNCFYPEDDKHSVCAFMVARYVSGEPQLAEPDKADQLRWCRWDEIPYPRIRGLQLVIDAGLHPANTPQAELVRLQCAARRLVDID